MVTMTMTQATQVAALTLATQPLAATTTAVVRPNLMYVLDDSGSMAWDYTPDYINDSTTAADPGSLGGNAGDGALAVIAGGRVTAINPDGSPAAYSHKYVSAPTVVILGGGGTGAAATVNWNSSTKLITSITVTNGGSGYTVVPNVAIVGTPVGASWGMCWGVSGATPLDTTKSPTCTATTQIPYATGAVNYQYYDPTVRYEQPYKADGTRYTNSTSTAASPDGFLGGTAKNLTSAFTHEVWCNSTTAAPTVADPTAAGKCRENADTTNDIMYPNAVYSVKKTYNGPAFYYTMSPSEYCTDDTYTNCVRSSTAAVSGGVTFNVPSNYRWCAYYNPASHSFGGCQGRRDGAHYIPNYLGGWVSTGAAGTQATGSLVISSVATGQQLTGLTVGGVDVIGGVTLTATNVDTPTTIVAALCSAVNANSASTGYGCSPSAGTATIQATVTGTAANGLPVLAAGPSAGAAANSLGSIYVLGIPPSAYTINGITISRLDSSTASLIGAAVPAGTTAGNTAQAICQAINSGPSIGVYVARSGNPADPLLDWGMCQSTVDAWVGIKRIPADDTDNGASILVTGPPATTTNSASITINSTGGATRIANVTLNGSSILTAPYNTSGIDYADGTLTSTIASDVASKISVAGCTASASGNVVTVSGTCTGNLAVSTYASTRATGVIRVKGSTNAANFAGITVGGSSTPIVGAVTATQIPAGSTASQNATLIQGLINAATSASSGGVGPHGFSAAAPVVNGSDYNITVSAPAGSTYDNASFAFLPGQRAAAAAGTRPSWVFPFTGASADNVNLTSITCGAATAVTTQNTGTSTANVDWVRNLAAGFTGKTSTIASGTYAGSYGFSCTNASIASPGYRCTVTGPANKPACTLAMSPTSGVSAGNIINTNSGAAPPQWTFNISGATTDSQNLNSLSCASTSIFSGTPSTGAPAVIDRIANLANDLVANGTVGYSYSKIAGATSPRQRIRVTGPKGDVGGQPFCNSNLAITKDGSITVAVATPSSGTISALVPSPAGTTYVAGAAPTYAVSLTGATSDGRAIHSLLCGSTCVWDDGSGSCASATNTGLTPTTGTTTAPTDYAAALATAINSNAGNSNGWSGTSNCTSGTNTVSCGFRRSSGDIYRCSSVTVSTPGGQTLVAGAAVESSTGSSPNKVYTYTIPISSVTVPNESITNVTCNRAAASDQAISGTATYSSNPASDARTDTFATSINNNSSAINGWNGTSGCARVTTTSVSCNFERNAGAANRCTDSPTVSATGSGILVSAITETGSDVAGWKYGFTITNLSSSDTFSSVRCNRAAATETGMSASASTGAGNGFSSVVVQRLNNLGSGLTGINQSGYSFGNSCTTATNGSPSVACTLTGPVASGSFPTCAFNTSGTITPTDPTLTRTGGTLSNNGTAAQWTFDITAATTDSRTIGNITCGGTNTLSALANTGTATVQTDTVRVNNLGTGLAGHGATNWKGVTGDNWTITQNTSATGTSPPTTPATFTATGPQAAYGCSWTKSLGAGITLSDPSPVAGTGVGTPSWTFDITNANANNLNFGTLTCGGTSILPSPTPSTGAASASSAYARLNNLTGATAVYAADGVTLNSSSQGTRTSGSYTMVCDPATLTSLQPSCTLTGPVGVGACNASTLTFNKDPSITVGGITFTDGIAAHGQIDDFITDVSGVTQVSAFTSGRAQQGTTPTPGTSVALASTSSGTICTNPKATTADALCAGGSATMSNGSIASVNTIPTNASGTPPNVLTMSGGADPDTTTNHWTDLGIFKRTDVVPGNNSYARGSARTDCVGATCTYAEEIQNFANWYTYYRTRMQMMKSATTLAFNPLDGKYRIGFDNICSATGTTVKEAVGQFVDSGGEVANQRVNWWSKLTTSSPSCATPLRAETGKIGRYYAGKLTSSGDPMQYSCQQNFMMLVTDGYWNENEPSATSVSGGDVGNTDNTAARPYYDGAQAATTCPSTGSARNANNSSCRTLSDITWYYYTTDLRTAALGNATGSGGVDVATNNVLTGFDDKQSQQHMNFFAMGLGIDGTLEYRSDYQTAGTGDYADIAAGSKNWPAVANLDPTGVDDLWHATVNGHGKYFSARNVPAAVAGLREALTKIGARVGSAAAAATSNLEPVAGDNFAYVASYATLDWTGDLQSRTINTSSGAVSSSTDCSSTTTTDGCTWSAQKNLDKATWSARRVFVKPTSGSSGDPLRLFTYDNLTGGEQALLSPSSLSQYATLSVSNPSDITATKLVDYLRGDRRLEMDGDTSHAQIWRLRAHVLGDIVDTQPVYNKAPNKTWLDDGYSEFKATGTAATRKPVVYVSSQDGMMHAFNAHTEAVTISGVSANPGDELWSYIPTQVMSSLKSLADVNYTSGHRYFVDGPITVSDVNFGGGVSDWHTILIGGQGGGGNSYFALDVTNPLAPTFLWEFTHANLGNSFANAVVTKLPTATNGWAVVFTSGYNNADGNGYLFAVNPKTGQLLSVSSKAGDSYAFPLSTGSGSAGSPSNLGKISVWVDKATLDNTAQYVYAGDLNGDLWRFDFNASAADHSGEQVFKLAHLSSGGVAQPISTKVELTTTSGGQHLVYVGTGKYLETSDLSSSATQSMYAIKDTLGAPNLGGSVQETWNPRSDLVPSTTEPLFLPRKLIGTKEDGSEVTITSQSGATVQGRMACAGTSSTVTSSGVCNHEAYAAMDWTSQGGWYMDLPEAHERLNVEPKLVQGTLVFASNIPEATSCTVGGRSYLNQLDASSGTAITVPDCSVMVTDSAGQSQCSKRSIVASTENTDSLVVGITLVRVGDQLKAIQTLANYKTDTEDVTPQTSATFLNKHNLWREFEVYK